MWFGSSVGCTEGPKYDKELRIKNSKNIFENENMTSHNVMIYKVIVLNIRGYIKYKVRELETKYINLYTLCVYRNFFL